MKLNMLIAGAKGFALQLLDVCLQLDEQADLSFFDNVNKDMPDKLFDQFRVLRTESEVKDYFTRVTRFFALGTGNPETRKYFFDWFQQIGGIPKTIVSPTAQIGKFDVSIGEGTTILTHSIIESTSKIGIGCLINLNVLVTHGTTIGDFCEISPGVRISGNCHIGNNVFIGTGAVILPGITIGNNSVIGAGAVVTKNIASGTTVIGVPAKEKQS